MTKKQDTPALKLHKGSGQGYVVLDGRRIYLGVYGSDETTQKYHRTVEEWLANGRRLPAPPDDITVVELCVRFMAHAKTYYRRPDGSTTSSLGTYQLAVRPMERLYGRTAVVDFGPRALKAVRQDMIDRGIARGTINQWVNLIRAVFRWGVEQEIVPVEVHTALCAVKALARGRSEARETEAVKAVPDAHIDAVREHVARQVWALIELQRLTGARAGELVGLRAIDLDTTGKVWTATLDQHKTSHHGRERILCFGPAAQAVIRPFMLGRALDAPLFSAREAHAEQRAAEATSRRRSDQQETPRKSDRVMGEQYTTASYRRAIQRACVAAKIPTWSPHQLRHTAATAIRRQFGIEGAQVMLGHARADVTQVYAEVNKARAMEIASKVG